MSPSESPRPAAPARTAVDARIGRLTIGRRLGLLVGLLWLAVMGLTVMAALGVGRIDRNIEDFHAGTFRRAAITVELRGALKNTELASLEYALIENEPRRETLRTRLAGTLIPAVNEALIDTETALGAARDRGDRGPRVRRMRDDWQLYLESAGPALLAADGAGEQAAAVRIQALLDRLIGSAEVLARNEETQAAQELQQASVDADSIRRRLIVTTLIAGLITTGIAILLTRSIVRRTRRYSRFAAAVAAGSYGERVELEGNDELTDLGELLNLMTEHRDVEQTREAQRLDFTDAMQLTGSEAEAHGLLKHHLERSIPDSVVTVLSRNNSSNRLEPTTVLDAADPISQSLNAAQPRDCLSVRSGQGHRAKGENALLECKICGREAASACQPLLVGGEVIGAVLARRDRALGETETETMRSSVVQAAPLLANLRNLAIAELRAGTDALTGLPNQRASHETMQRMTAQSERAGSHLSVLLLDLDHFKQVNDVYGHAEGDNVLAAVGVTLRSTIREGDFCGRFGGEEFLILLPDTDLDSAALVAEKIRAGVERIQVPSVRRDITISIGVASFPDHGTEAATVARIADRALYAAKEAGRNRVEVARRDAMQPAA